MDLLEQCELDDEKLMGKTSRQRGPKVGESETGDRESQTRQRRGTIKVHKGTTEKVQRRLSERRKEEEGDSAGRCLKSTPTESIQDTILKNKEGATGEKEKNPKKIQRKDPTPLGDGCQAVSRALCVLSFVPSTSLSFFLSLCHIHLYAPSISHDSTLLPPSPCFPLLPSPHPYSLSLSPSPSLHIYIRPSLEG